MLQGESSDYSLSQEKSAVETTQAGADAHEIMVSVLVTHTLRGENFLEEGVKFMRNQLARGVIVKKVDSPRLNHEKNSIFFI